MSQHFLLDWAATAVSLANTILLLWLGATVLLNADRRTWGIWLAGGGLLLGGAFFVSHTAILGLEFTHLSRSLRFWWYLGLMPVVALPLGWYVVMLWYAGFWAGGADNRLYRRQQRWLLLLLPAGVAGLLAVVVYANPSPERFSLLPLRFTIQNLGGTTLLVAGYALFLVLCLVLSLDALLRPGPTERVMGQVARQRARGWLVAASLLLLLVSVLVIAALLWILLSVRQNGVYTVTDSALRTLARFDLLISSLIAAATLVLGQAVVAYEIFTGKTLPRGGLRRQWQRAILLAAGYGALVGYTLSTEQRPVYSVLLATLLMVAFFALLGWRSYAERERYIAHLRPFVSSQRLYDHLLAPAPTAPELDAREPFRALCRDVLGARRAYLVPRGPLAALAGSPLHYPQAPAAALPPLDDVAQRFSSPHLAYLPLDPAQYAGASWAIPLWSERGLIGLLLLGERRDGSIYTQEEMEIARASGERLIDVQASAEMARRLLALQRQRLTETQLADRRTRRVLHDEVLPQIHAALLTMSQQEAGTEGQSAPGVAAGVEPGVAGQMVSALSDVHRQISDLLREIPPAVTPEVQRLGALGALQRALAQEFEGAFEAVAWDVSPELVAYARKLPPLTGEALFYAAREAVRNAARHGRGHNEGRPLHLKIRATAPQGGLELSIEDNGVGLGQQGEHGDEGRGLALHSTMMAIAGGTLVLDSRAGDYTRVRLSLPPEAVQGGG